MFRIECGNGLVDTFDFEHAIKFIYWMRAVGETYIITQVE